ncbi:APC family permease [Pseudobacter ginsenosidimutans]|uniref:Amino acid/polyamine/organocation transporter (APC superfamily) n=1 Tax=Pseudobacter ginsenosidimutans TaxID=661488 RepID=A0A4Q7MC68_9BACT|nr:amino acid permease [Pseudobacter ginsenosidimutans]QEC45315.1 amino acid permease [Pseudobacter ginsenosidimutans]RZS65584.1 amino acid/polyamine/organocation transporter (APC superfamily) [Pseudobacter ginsenosidimutans]
MAIPSARRMLGFWSATSIVVGSIIGSGVFMKPATMAAQTASPVWLALVWVVAGLLSLIGGLIYAEVGAMFPQTGGLYIYFQKMFGDFFAFMYGWAGFAVINTAAVSAISFVCAQYADFFLQLPQFAEATEKAVVWHIPLLGNLYPLENAGVKSLAIALIVGLTWLNYRSVKAGGIVQVVSTMIKVGVIILLVFGIFLSGNGSVQHFVQPSANPKEGWQLAGGLVAALTGAFMAYDGWVNVTFVGGEIKDPQRNIPRSLLMGLLSCVIIYLLVNQAYLYVLPVDRMSASSLVAADAIAIALGETSGAIVAAMIVICTFGAINGNTMTEARVTYAMGKDRLFFAFTGKEHTKYGTPGNALWLHCVWASVLVVSGSFDMLADMFVFVAWVAYTFGAIGVFVLRRKMPDHPRPYRVWGYPLVPLLFIGFAAFYVISTIMNDINKYNAGQTPVINSLLGLVITALGAPLYLYFRKSKTKARSSL